MPESKTIKKTADMVCKIILAVISAYYIYLAAKSGILINEIVQKFFALFTVIIIEGFPFILIGSFISAVINSYVSEDLIFRIMGRNSILSIFAASLTGLLFPVCECGIVSVIKKLTHKKLPLHLAVTIMVSVPIINPIVILTTFLAFYGRADIVISRIVSGILISNLTGIITFIRYKNTASFLTENDHHSHEGCSCHSCRAASRAPAENIFSCIDHALIELYSIGRYFITGSFIAALIRTCIPVSMISMFSENNTASILLMLFLAFSMSVCSESDAFIARKFSGIFPDSSIVGFLVLGPMLDLKNTIMLLNAFKKEVVIFLIITITSLCFLNSLILSLIL